MHSDDLQDHVTQLHQELSTVHQVDEATREMLVTLMQDITQVLKGEKQAGDAADSPTSEGIRDLVTQFEVEHPKLARTLGQLADGLANLGI